MIDKSVRNFNFQLMETVLKTDLEQAVRMVESLSSASDKSQDFSSTDLQVNNSF